MKMVTGYAGWQEDELRREQARLQAEYEAYRRLNLKLDMSRGKPCPEQLQLSNEMLDVLPSGEELRAEDGTDCRNYGGLDGLPEAKRFFAEMLGVQSSEVIVQGNSSLNLMYDALARAMLFGVLGSEQPWSRLPSVKFLCPSPGYDRHFAICEQLNIEMITVDMTPEGPDMDAVERLVAEDDSIKGIWCVPKYSNPGGITYSDETVERLARMKTRTGDFRIFWDDAYTVHHLTSRHDELKNMLEACSNAGNPDRVFIFASTSKVTFPGSGVAALAASRDNLSHLKKQLSVQTIGPDKVNQLRHIRFLKDMEHLGRHMEEHAAIIKPKFDLVLNKLESGIGSKDIASWSKPSGGYFISLDTMDGCAREVVQRAAEAGVTLTPAGATYPYGRDPRDRNIRIAPTYPSLEELAQAIDILCVCVQLVSIDRILAEQ
ncbi:aminotransferase class I/II-fold pyridoxal phosphate-dependent enzyme [Paenibacillus favisporus]|uniref:aminotransferase class I/II-fold pyridoxal phosphate-dependent enzyme n=1 Tax=Paenibacillus favisporus TaxID=221028 RepID=UPI0013D2E317